MNNSFQYFVSTIAMVAFIGCNGSKNSKPKFAPSQNNEDVELLEERELKEANAALVEEFLGLTESITNRHKSLERERDRRGKLQSELLGLGGADSCMLDMPIEKIEFFIDGKKLENIDVSAKLGKAKNLTAPDQGSSLEFEFILGDGQKRLVFTNDELQERIFVRGRNKIFPIEEQGYKLGDFKFIKIKKPNHFHIKDFVCQGKTEQMCQDENQGHAYRVVENYRYMMNKIRVKVNNILVYQNDVVDFGFAQHKKNSEQIKANGLEWHDPNITLNEAFIKILQVESCSF